MCEKALAEYLETKRLAFPRFYFVSSADLLDILSNGNNPIEVMIEKGMKSPTWSFWSILNVIKCFVTFRSASTCPSSLIVWPIWSSKRMMTASLSRRPWACTVKRMNMSNLTQTVTALARWTLTNLVATLRVCALCVVYVCVFEDSTFFPFFPGQVEAWLNRVLERMVETLRSEFGEAVQTYEEKAREQWLFDYPAQVLTSVWSL